MSVSSTHAKRNPIAITQNYGLIIEDTQYTLYRRHTVDPTKAPGYDQRTGHGVFRLPEIIAAPTYDVITATVGSVIGTYNGDRVNLAAAPQLIDGRVFVGLRDVAELFGASVAWDNAKKTVTIKRKRR
ncbi:copper amine oxidase N-terminal domain-containing protein [Paenibacillus paridis]|uniref:copper amine oxidase N-terminal domain-containing protein n=1 Tax=Paenibacillus paridis TaxID=2583376 RepID=UPI001121E305|nr:copper amine oxidase N-terminal domain-containing protein [Paenibacillus paridis]